MLYRNTKTGDFGITYDQLRTMMPLVSFVKGANVIGDFEKYERTVRPIVNNPYQLIVEKAPVDGLQVWEVVDPEITPTLITRIKNDLKAKVTDLRWQKESSGVTLPNGMSIATAKDDLDRMNSVLVNAPIAGISEFDFKSASGWVKITIEQLGGISVVVSHFVQRCFTKERTYHELIEATNDFHDLLNLNIFDWYIDLGDIYATVFAPPPEPEEEPEPPEGQA